jgi:polyphenol oxidase
MLQRRTSELGVVIYFSPLLEAAGVPHAFSTRVGGVSPAPFDSLNLGNPNGCDIQDLTDRIRENYRRLLLAAGCGERQRLWTWQVHGARVLHIVPGAIHDNDTKADAMITADPARALSIRVADCVPVLMSSDDGRTVAAIHAGWRGVVDGVAVEAVQEMTRHERVPPEKIIAAIGPSIGFDAFEVGPEVLAEFQRVFGTSAPIRRREDGKGQVDLRESLRRQLLTTGVTDDHIDLTDRCTHRDREEFYSHRRDCGITGRMAAVIATKVS